MLHAFYYFDPKGFLRNRNNFCENYLINAYLDFE